MTTSVILVLGLGSLLLVGPACNGDELGGPTGGSGGVSNVGGQGASGGTGGRASGSGGTIADAGNQACGSAVCGAGEFCCNASCSICAPRGGACIEIFCAPDSGIRGDAGACHAVPTQDGMCADAGYPPHYYACNLTMLPPPCVEVIAGNVMEGFCCN
jgi:hypothetical protein